MLFDLAFIVIFLAIVVIITVLALRSGPARRAARTNARLIAMRRRRPIIITRHPAFFDESPDWPAPSDLPSPPPARRCPPSLQGARP